jgi:hypothetical protein
VERWSGMCNWGRYQGMYSTVWGFKILCMLIRIRYLRGWVDPVLGPLLLRKSGSGGNRTRTSGFVARNSGH